jgi:hypothetical protein
MFLPHSLSGARGAVVYMEQDSAEEFCYNLTKAANDAGLLEPKFEL